MQIGRSIRIKQNHLVTDEDILLHENSKGAFDHML